MSQNSGKKLHQNAFTIDGWSLKCGLSCEIKQNLSLYFDTHTNLNPLSDQMFTNSSDQLIDFF